MDINTPTLTSQKPRVYAAPRGSKQVASFKITCELDIDDLKKKAKEEFSSLQSYFPDQFGFKDINGHLHMNETLLSDLPTEDGVLKLYVHIPSNVTIASQGIIAPDPTQTSFWTQLNKAISIDNVLVLMENTHFPTRPDLSTLLIRKSYTELYDIIVKTERPSQITVLKGNPGIGKSMFLFFYLWKKRCSGSCPKNIVFDCFSRDAIHFTFDHMNKPVAYVGNRTKFEHIVRQEDTIYLVDGQTPMAANSFVLLATYPRRNNYEQYAKERANNTFIIPVWTLDEITVANSQKQYMRDVKQVIERYRGWGGIPRYVLEKIDLASQQELQLAIGRTDYETIIFGSEYIKDMIAQRFYWNWTQQVVDAIEKGCTDLSSANIGKLFEQLCQRTIQFGQEFDVRPLDGLGDEFNGTLELPFNGVNGFKDMNALKEMDFRKHKPTNDILWRPSESTFPCVDSFAFRDGEQCYMFKVTYSSKPHSISHVEYGHLINALSLGDTTKFYLFFIVPNQTYLSYRLQNFVTNNDSLNWVDGQIPNLPQCRQYALRINFSGLTPSTIYPLHDQDSIESSNYSSPTCPFPMPILFD
ncbi:hypothetical protein SAMD00019534_091020 [Acytostelium subglobosum LB1]|uniref:hypothetical protein n=1 Tax=Acytostelium subglobosum LB1 TaxID=1410327 RepID=UPI0006449B65|nr:hypothetical protein SAMD00019534_091020 [Acytostelium subglobosum LB1]GAM25927.1 hypothetical protein SAMD00019534_091020 [Acytostelium subglobosum LB1]|eukprot:XP_012750970.1 hypothetical protein SAMD00019534_091020 [Acytostelium subglobosum LB1]